MVVRGERLWVTGLGLVTPLGWGVEPTWARLVRGDRGLRDVTLFDTTGQRARVAGEVEGVRVPSPGWSRTSVMAAHAAEEAMDAAGVRAGAMRIGLVVGGTTSGMFETEHLLARMHAEPESREVLLAMLSHPLTSTGDRLNERLGPFVRVRSLSSACSSGANALLVAALWLLEGELDAVVAGGSDGLCRLTLTGFNALAALDPEGCRPFDRRRRGTSLGEGAGFLVLERADNAVARGARPIAELAGWAAGSEAHHITNPAPDGEVVGALVSRALARAGLSPADVDYVSAHGTGTPLNDASEAAGLARALGAEMERVAVSSSKGQIGHTLGAAGAIEAAVTALVVSRRTLVPTAGLDEPDPELRLVHVPHVGRQVARVRAALSSAFGFGGMDTVLVFREPYEARWPSAAPSRPTRRTAVLTGAAAFGPFGLVSGSDGASLLESRCPLETPVDPDAFLDAGRARRLDRAARLGAVTAERALRDAGGPAAGTGIVVGNAFGNLDSCAAFMHRIFDKGPRAASPAEFPNLVPSSPVGHMSIYLGLHGVSFTTADLAASGESAVAQAVDLVQTGEAERIVAGAVEPKSDLVERVFAELFAQAPSHRFAGRADLAAVVVVESEEAARSRHARVLARVVSVLAWRGEPAGVLRALEGPAAGTEVILPRASSSAVALLEETAWGTCPRIACAPSLGESEALGAAALAIAAGRLAAGRAPAVLVLGLAQGRGYAVLLAAA
jgi:3-oxoacyl-[acyl-carrier-protein] synthase II